MATLRNAAAGIAGLFLTWLAPEALAAPDYIRADQQELSAAYGKEFAARIFSDNLTPIRQSAIGKTVEQVPRLECPQEPGFVLTDVYPIEIGDAVVWIERFDVTCDRPVRRSFLMVLHEDQVKATPMAPGETLADVHLQADAGKTIRMAALARGPQGCESSVVIDTAVIEKPPKANAGWYERWSVKTCDEVVELDVLFTPSPAGGAAIRVLAPKGTQAENTAGETPHSDGSGYQRPPGTFGIRVTGCCIIHLPSGWFINKKGAKRGVPVEEAAAQSWPMPFSAQWRNAEGGRRMLIDADPKPGSDDMNQRFVASLDESALAAIDNRYRAKIEGGDNILDEMFGRKVSDYQLTQRVKTGPHILLGTSFTEHYSSGAEWRVLLYRYLAGASSFHLEFKAAPSHVDEILEIVKTTGITPARP